MRFAEIASGAGGLGIGLQRAGFSFGGAWDVDPAAVETYKANVSRCAAVLDVSDLTVKRDEYDLLVSGLPCESFSTLGMMDSSDLRGRLWYHFVRNLEIGRPLAFLIENVPTFLGTFRFKLLVGRTQSLGYSTSWAILDARSFGVAQERRRVFVLGSLNGLVEMEPNGHSPFSTVRDAIGDLPIKPDERNDHIGYSHRAKSVERYQLVPPGGDWRDLPKSMMNPCWRKLKTAARGVLGRLRWDAPANTIRTTFIKPETGRYIHPEADRGLTIREGARLQGFDDDFRFPCGGLQTKARLIGRAVPPPMAEGLGRLLREVM